MIKNILGNKIAKRILIHLYRNPKIDYYQQKIFKGIGCPISSCQSIKDLERLGLIIKSSALGGRIKYIRLTKKGKGVAEELDKLDVLMR